MHRFLIVAFASGAAFIAGSCSAPADVKIVVGAGAMAEIRGTENFFGTYLGLDTAGEDGRSGLRDKRRI